MRLRLRTDVGVLELVPVGNRDIDKTLRWSWPNRGSITYGEVLRMCRARGWPQPELVPRRVVRRVEIDDEIDGGNHG